MANIFCVFREVGVLCKSQDENRVAIISHDEKPGI